MKKLIFAALLVIGFAAPAAATELNPDVPCSNSAAWMVATGWSVSGGKCVGSGATQMKMLHQMTSKVKAGHRYRMTFTVGNYSAGKVRAFVGVTMPTFTPGTWKTLASESDIADNFDYSSAVRHDFTPKASYTGPGDSLERGGAARFQCFHAGFAYTDPLVYPGVGSPHLHEFYGNTGIANAKDQDDWDTNDFRTRGGSTCGNNGENVAINRSGYWIPAMFDGEGNVLKARSITLYYKGPSNPALDYTGNVVVEGQGDPATECIEGTPAPHICVGIPRHLRMTFGYRSSTGLEGPLDTVTASGGYHWASQFRCFSGAPGNEGGGGIGNAITPAYESLQEVMDSGLCPLNSQFYFQIVFPYCWDGVHVDSPDHRAHVSYGGPGGVCDAGHPDSIPAISIQAFYTVDQAFLDGKWHLASDEMATNCEGVAVTAGCTSHGDYWEAWSPTARNAWFTQCIWPHNSCNFEFGDTTGMRQNPTGYVGHADEGAGGSGGYSSRPDEKTPLTQYGMSKDYSANGTYTVDMTAAKDGEWGFMGFAGFTGELDNVSLQEIPLGAKGPVTVTN